MKKQSKFITKVIFTGVVFVLFISIIIVYNKEINSGGDNKGKEKNMSGKNKNTEKDTNKGAFKVNCGKIMAGGRFVLKLSNDETVDKEVLIENYYDDGSDGMSYGDTVYCFTGKYPGTVQADIYEDLPTMDELQLDVSKKLFVDDEYRVHEYKGLPFKSFKLVETGMRASRYVIEGKVLAKGEASLEVYDEDFDGNKHERYPLKQDKKTYEDLKALLEYCDIKSWDGFFKSNNNVLDGYSFTFEAVLEDGSKISAGGNNASPKSYHTFTKLIYFLAKTE